MAYAHSRNAQGKRHDLLDHLRATAELAAAFAEPLGASEAARFLGLCHDAGKFNPAFQQYLLDCEANPKAKGHGPDHKAAGTQLTLKHLGPISLVIQGHHGGLRTLTDLQSWISQRLADPATADALDQARRAIPLLEPVQPIPLPQHAEVDRRAAELFMRLLFSALVDADFLDTEGHFAADRAELRGGTVTIDDLWERFERDQQQRFTDAPDTPVNRLRNEVYESCLGAADQPPGFFRLTVPTGGGKTRAAMAFALRHALRHGQRRIIVAVPFITITQQTADVYRQIFGAGDDPEPTVLEHHSEAFGNTDEDDAHPIVAWSRLAAENWDAPIVVTTTVQLFESLFANGTSRCRKLHRLANSVIILDEAQSLPSHLLEPILDGLQQLGRHYRTTVVLSTATQPAFESLQPFAAITAREIVPEPGRLFTAMKRVTYSLRCDTTVEWSDVAALLADQSEALVVLNTKRDALALLDALGDPDALHLSTLLCGAHRRHVIGEVKRRLRDGEPCRLVSTQVVEAGVDLDFPLVMRALGPLDSIIQAAGRCNREGRLETGQVIVFRPAEGGLPPGSYRTGTELAQAILTGQRLDPDRPEIARAYFKQLFTSVPTDREGIQPIRERFEYPEVARRFQMIEPSESVVVTTYGSDAEQARVRRLIGMLRAGTPHTRWIFRHLQTYLVAMRVYEARRYREQGFISPVLPGLGEWLGRYDPVRGIVAADPEWIV
ncbi:MAG: CRISPR-associated helicase Cas3' [Chloroflexi bacterium]|nr:CRISPR-associated helicase Cas3' [Chloroflexota bacterium]